jgi:Ino eighty subunit 2
MTTRPRRTIVPTRRRLDMEMDSDAEMEDHPEPEEEERENDNDIDMVDDLGPEEDGPNVDIDVEGVAQGEHDAEDDVDDEADEEDEDDQEDEIQSDNGHDGEEVQPTPSSSRLRIKLKIPVPPSRSAGTETPGVESEDSMESHPSTSTTAKPMTTRQAVLASMVDSSHVSLGGSRQSKKKVLNESELALRREETARKRKNMTEKKLEDEKVLSLYNFWFHDKAT